MIRQRNFFRSIPRCIPVVLPLPVSNSPLLSCSLKPLFTSVYNYMKSNRNLIKLHNNMQTLGSSVYYLPIAIEDYTIEVHLSMNSLDFKLSYKNKEVKIGFLAENIKKHLSSDNVGLNKHNFKFHLF